MYTARLEIGVSVFFLISGFLLYRPFVVAHLAGARKPRTGAFWLRRLLRIVPAYWLALFITTSVLHAGPGIGPGGWKAYATHYLFLQIYLPSQDLRGITAAWSLCVEMTFYLFIPLYAALLGRRRSRRTDAQTLRLELAGLVVMLAVSYGWRLFILRFQAHTPYYRLATVWLPAYLDLFALGMLLAIVSTWFAERDSEPLWLSSRLLPWISWIAAALAFVVVSHVVADHSILYFVKPRVNLERQFLYGVFAFFLLVPAVFGPQDRTLIRRLLRSWPMASLGVISYGIYLWHLNLIDLFLQWTGWLPDQEPYWLLVLAVLGLSIGFASVSYFGLERPILRWKRRISWWDRSTSSKRSPAAEQRATHDLTQ